MASFDFAPEGCAPLEVTFTNQSEYADSYLWDFDDGTPPDTIIFPDDPNVYHIYNNIGIYGPTLEVYNSQGCSHTYTRIIEIDGKPVGNGEVGDVWLAAQTLYCEHKFDF